MAKNKSPIAKATAKRPGRPNQRLRGEQPIAMVKAMPKDTRKRERPNRVRPKREKGLELDKRPHSRGRAKNLEQRMKPVRDEPKEPAAEVRHQDGAKAGKAEPLEAEEERRAPPALEERKEPTAEASDPEGAKPVEARGRDQGNLSWSRLKLFEGSSSARPFPAIPLSWL